MAWKPIIVAGPRIHRRARDRTVARLLARAGRRTASQFTLLAGRAVPTVEPMQRR